MEITKDEAERYARHAIEKQNDISVAKFLMPKIYALMFDYANEGKTDIHFGWMNTVKWKIINEAQRQYIVNDLLSNGFYAEYVDLDIGGGSEGGGGLHSLHVSTKPFGKFARTERVKKMKSWVSSLLKG